MWHHLTDCMPLVSLPSLEGKPCEDEFSSVFLMYTQSLMQHLICRDPLNKLASIALSLTSVIITIALSYRPRNGTSDIKWQRWGSNPRLTVFHFVAIVCIAGTEPRVSGTLVFYLYKVFHCTKMFLENQVFHIYLFSIVIHTVKCRTK